MTKVSVKVTKKGKVVDMRKMRKVKLSVIKTALSAVKTSQDKAFSVVAVDKKELVRTETHTFKQVISASLSLKDTASVTKMQVALTKGFYKDFAGMWRIKPLLYLYFFMHVVR